MGEEEEDENEEPVVLTQEDAGKAWGKAVTAKLRQGPFKVFHKITSCELSLIPDGDESALIEIA